MSNWSNNKLNAHLKSLDDAEAKEIAIEALAERLMIEATKASRNVINAYNNHLSMTDVVKITSNSEEFNDVFYKIAEKVINARVKG
jgi:hypothetical protein